MLTERLAGMEGLLRAGQRRLPGAVAAPGAQLFQASSVGIPALRYAEWPGAGCEFLCLGSGWLIDHVSAAEETHLWCGSPRANLRGEREHLTANLLGPRSITGEGRDSSSDCEQVLGWLELSPSRRRVGRSPESHAWASLSRCESETWSPRSNAQGFSSNRSRLCPERLGHCSP